MSSFKFAGRSRGCCAGVRLRICRFSLFEKLLKSLLRYVGKKQTCPVTNSTPTWRLRYLARHIPAALPARHRSLQPAKPAPRSGFFPGKKCRGCRLSRQPLRKIFQLSCGGTTGKSFGEPARQSRASPPTWRHAADVSITNYEAVSGYFGHWLHRAQVSLLTGKIGQIKLSHIRKKTLVRAWCAPGACLARAWCGPGAGSKTEAAEPASLSRSPTDCDTCGNLCRRGVGMFDIPTSGDACEGALKYNTPTIPFRNGYS